MVLAIHPRLSVGAPLHWQLGSVPMIFLRHEDRSGCTDHFHPLIISTAGMKRHGKSNYRHQERALHCIRKKTLESLSDLLTLVSSNERAWSKARDINGSFEKLKDFISWDFCRIKMILNRLNPYCNICKIFLAGLSWRVNGTESYVWSLSSWESLISQSPSISDFISSRIMFIWSQVTAPRAF